MMNTIKSVILLLFFAPNIVHAAGSMALVELDSGMSFSVSEDDEAREVTISLLQGFTDKKRTLEIIKLANSALLDPGYEKVKFDKSGDSYLITMWNNTSNYGARKGIVVYKRQWWKLFVLPFDVFDVNDLNGDGFFEISSDENTYFFEGGLLQKVDKKEERAGVH